MYREAVDLESSNGGERDESNCRKDDRDLWYEPGPPAELGEFPRAVWSGKQQHFLQQLQALDAQEMLLTQAVDKGPCTPLGWQTTEGSRAGGFSFLLLPRRRALSSRWLWTSNHNTCEKRLEEVQGAATSSRFPPPHKTKGRVYSSCVRSAMLNGSET